MGKIRLFYLLLSILFLVIGMFIYILFRDISHLFIINRITKLGFIQTIFIELKPSILTNILLYNIPDMFWFISGILLLRFIWFYRTKEQNIYLYGFYITGAAFEISQLSENIPGTFDYLDLFFMGMGGLVERLLYNNYIRRR